MSCQSRSTARSSAVGVGRFSGGKSFILRGCFFRLVGQHRLFLRSRSSRCPPNSAFHRPFSSSSVSALIDPGNPPGNPIPTVIRLTFPIVFSRTIVWGGWISVVIGMCPTSNT